MNIKKTSNEMPATKARTKWSGDRMSPNYSDNWTESIHWQRYLYFRPLYDSKKVIDAGCGEGYGTHYISIFAKEAIGVDNIESLVQNASKRYPQAKYIRDDVSNMDYSESDVVICFDTLSFMSQPEKFLKNLSKYKGTIVISSPNKDQYESLKETDNKNTDGLRWNTNEFVDLIKSSFKNKPITFFSQKPIWPGNITEGISNDALSVIAVINCPQLPVWPSIGLTIPTHNQAQMAIDSVVNFTKYYPGKMGFTVVANGCDKESLGKLQALETAMPATVKIIECSENMGYGVGTNIGLEYLYQNSSYEFFGVSNDDVVPAIDCINEMVYAFKELENQGYKPGVIGPKSNLISGQQQVDIGQISNAIELRVRTDAFQRANAGSVTQVRQLRGLLLLFSKECLDKVGGFDPRFGIGNFEDDDHNLRCHLAGFTLWMADGAFLYHLGSSTFRSMGIDYTNNIERNMILFNQKWGLEDHGLFGQLETKPENVNLHIPLSARRVYDDNYQIVINKEPVHLIDQASDTEFAAWVSVMLSDYPRDKRKFIADYILQLKSAA